MVSSSVSDNNNGSIKRYGKFKEKIAISTGATKAGEDGKIPKEDRREKVSSDKTGRGEYWTNSQTRENSEIWVSKYGQREKQTW